MLSSLKDRKTGKTIKHYTEQLYNPIQTFSKMATKMANTSKERRSPVRPTARTQDVLSELNTPTALYQYTPVVKPKKKEISSPSKGKKNKSKKKTSSKKDPEVQKGLIEPKGVVFKSAHPTRSKSPQAKVIFRKQHGPSYKVMGPSNLQRYQCRKRCYRLSYC